MRVAHPLAFLAPEHRDDPYPALVALRDTTMLRGLRELHVRFG